MFSKSKALRFMPGSLRLRMTLLFVLIFGAMLIMFSTLLYRAFVVNNQALFDTELYNHAIDISETIEVDPLGEVTISGDPFSTRGKVFFYATGKVLLQIRDFDGRILARSSSLGKSELPFSEHDLKGLDRTGYTFFTINRKEMPRVPGRTNSGYRMISYVVQKFPLNRYILQLAVPLTILEKESSALLLFNSIAIPFALILAAFGGLFLSRRALLPINDIIERTQALSHTNLSERLPVPKTEDELKRLTLTLNELLNRLDRAFKAQERFVSDASHELRTPLAILRGELDLLKSRVRTPLEIDGFIASASQELDRLSRLVQDLLILARADISRTFLPMKQVRLDELAIEASSSLEKIAKQKGVRIRLDLSSETPEFEVLGDPDLLYSMLRNLIENAIKFSPENGVITIQLIEAGGVITLEISDQGPGIPADALPRIFDRFFRNTNSTSDGFGLGLAIVRQIVEAHQGKIDARSSSGKGTTIRVEIKKF